MKKLYCVPFISSHDLSKLHFFKNQATCDPNTILGGQDLVFSGINCGVIGGSQVTFCLNGAGDLSEQLNGLIITGNGPAEAQLSNCALAPVLCPGTGYQCDVSGGPFAFQCVLSIECPDGSLVTPCSDQTTCQISTIPTDSIG